MRHTPGLESSPPLAYILALGGLALAVIERVEALTPGDAVDRTPLAERLEAFTDRRVFRYWTLVGIVNGWLQPPVTEASATAWEWYARALRAHA